MLYDIINHLVNVISYLVNFNGNTHESESLSSPIWNNQTNRPHFSRQIRSRAKSLFFAIAGVIDALHESFAIVYFIGQGRCANPKTSENIFM